MADAQFQGPLDRGLQIGLVLCRHFFQRHILPLVLVAHPAAAEDGHVQFRYGQNVGKSWGPVYQVIRTLGSARIKDW